MALPEKTSSRPSSAVTSPGRFDRFNRLLRKTRRKETGDLVFTGMGATEADIEALEWDQAEDPKLFTSLSLQQNTLSKVPAVVLTLTRLTSLDLSTNGLASLPDELATCLPELAFLYLNDNDLESLPENIGQLTKLRFLICNSNSLKALPASVTALTSLNHLDVERNAFPNGDAIPSLSGLTRMQELTFASNRLGNALPDTSQMPRLQTLSLHFCRIVSLSEARDFCVNLRCLATLDVSMNRLTELPDSLGTCTSLTELRADNNRLTVLPESFTSLVQMRLLKLSRNRIRSFPLVVTHMTRLHSLALDNNDLSAVPRSVIQSLRDLRVIDILEGNRFPAPAANALGSTTPSLLSRNPRDVLHSLPSSEALLDLNTTLQLGDKYGEAACQVLLAVRGAPSVSPESFDEAMVAVLDATFQTQDHHALAVVASTLLRLVLSSSGVTKELLVAKGAIPIMEQQVLSLCGASSPDAEAITAATCELHVLRILANEPTATPVFAKVDMTALRDAVDKTHERELVHHMELLDADVSAALATEDVPSESAAAAAADGGRGRDAK